MYILRRIEGGTRQSNFELLRIIAMFLVLMVHSGYRFTGLPNAETLHNNPIFMFWCVSNQCISVICVDVFVMISGWFGIRLTTKKLMNFIFQCMYFIIGIYATAVIVGVESFTIKGILNCFLLAKSYWFIKCYMALMLVSPVLNAFIENTSKELQKRVIISLFLFQTIFGWIRPATGFINDGYSLFSFVILYLVMRYLRNSSSSIKLLSKRMTIIIVFSCLTLNILLSFLFAKLNLPLSFLASYISPLVIIQALFVVLLFSKLNFHSVIINFIAESCFAVFLLHTHESIFVKYYGGYIVQQYANNNISLAIINIITMMVMLFIIAVLLDQPRKLMWRLLNK